MFSVFKKLTKSSEDAGAAPTPMSSALQKKFARGVDYNMKIIIKGDRNVGKSCLLQRLQGGPFIEEYRPTDEIQAAGINWAYKNSHHIVKVDVWEVVDKGKSKKKASNPLKIDNYQSEASDIETPTLDATFLDVYKNADGIVLMLDITKNWTFEYVMKELSIVPADIPVAVLGNHCDMQHHRQVQQHHIDSMMEFANKNRKAVTQYCEASMRNGFGLRFLHRFLNIPFLTLQRRSLLAQLQRNSQEATDAVVDLHDFLNSEECVYESFSRRLAERRTGANSTDMTPRSAKSIIIGAGKPILANDVNPLANSKFNYAKSNVNMPNDGMFNMTNADREDGDSQVQFADEKLLAESVAEAKETEGNSRKSSNELDSFCPGALDTNFLEETNSTPKTVTVAPQSNSMSTFASMDYGNNSDSEDDVANPMVACVLEDLESPEQSERIDSESLSLRCEGDNVWDVNEIVLGGRRSPEGLENPDQPLESDVKEKKHKSKKSKSKEKDKDKKKNRKKEKDGSSSTLLDSNSQQRLEVGEYDPL